MVRRFGGEDFACWYRVHIDLDAVRTHLSVEDATAYSHRQVRAWLRAAGFVWVDDAWAVPEDDLGHLFPSEVLSIEPCGPPRRRG